MRKVAVIVIVVAALFGFVLPWVYVRVLESINE
jgi:hypothetical protein